jgi:hypothetical protein
MDHNVIIVIVVIVAGVDTVNQSVGLERRHERYGGQTVRRTNGTRDEQRKRLQQLAEATATDDRRHKNSSKHAGRLFTSSVPF